MTPSMNAHNEQQARQLLALGLDEFGHHTEAANVRKGIDLDDYKVDLWAIRAALDAKPSPVVKQNLTTQPAAAQEAVAYCQPDDPISWTAFSWHGLNRKLNHTMPLYAAPVAAVPVVDPSRLGAAMTAFDDAGGHAVRYAPEWMRRALEAASTPAAPGIDLEQFREAVAHWKRDLYDDYKDGHIHDGGEAMRKAEHLLALIDASPKGVCNWPDCGHDTNCVGYSPGCTGIGCRKHSPKGGSTPAPRFELTNGQIAQLADFAGTPVAGTPLEDQDVLVIQYADSGHSGQGLYAHYDELPDEGAIYLDGQMPDSPKGGSEARDAVLAELVEAISAFKGKRGAFMALGAQDERTVRLWWALANAQAGDAEVQP